MSFYGVYDAENDTKLILKSCHDSHYKGVSSFPSLFAGANEEAFQTKLQSYYRMQEELQSVKNACREVLNMGLLKGQDLRERNTEERQAVRETGEDSMNEGRIVIVRESKKIFFGSAVSIAQAQRDIERDRLVIEGTFITGAEMRFQALRTHLALLVENKLKERLTGKGKVDLSSLSIHVSDEILLRSSRTFSGGASFNALAHHLSENVSPVPLSNLASPCNVRLTINATPCRLLTDKGTSQGIGSLVAEIDTTTVFLVKKFSQPFDADQSEILVEEEKTVSVKYQDSVIVPLAPLQLKQEGRVDSLVFPGERTVSITGLV